MIVQLDISIQTFQRTQNFFIRPIYIKTKYQAINGGDDRIRTGDLLRARQALYQLSYIPIRMGTRSSKALGGPKSTRTTDLPVINEML